MSIFLDEILEKVRESDLEIFEQKFAQMEKEQEARLHSQNLESINDIVKRKFSKQIEDIATASSYIDATPLVENEVKEDGQPVEKNSETLYEEFLKKLKG